MRKIEGLGLTMPAVVAGLLVLGMGVAVVFTTSLVPPLSALAAVPRATLAAPRAGPAIYPGRLYSATPRVSPVGTKAALYWYALAALLALALALTVFGVDRWIAAAAGAS